MAFVQAFAYECVNVLYVDGGHVYSVKQCWTQALVDTDGPQTGLLLFTGIDETQNVVSTGNINSRSQRVTDWFSCYCIQILFMGCDLSEVRGREVHQDVQGNVGCPRGQRTFEESSQLEEENTIQSYSRQRWLLTVTVNQRLNFKWTMGCLD